MKVRKVFALSILTTSVALAAGCSSDDDDATPATETPGTETPGTETPGTEMPGTEMPGTEMPGTEMPGTEMPGTEMPGTETPTPSPAATMTGDSIIDLARGTDDGAGTTTDGVADLSSLVTTLGDYPDLVDLLDDPDKMFTVFAPNNEAFAALDLSAIPEEEREAAVRNVLTYHVVPDTVYDTSMDQTLPQSLVTAQGATLMIVDDGAGNAVAVDNDGTQVMIGTATSAGNGVVYIIDSVLAAPPAPEEPEDMTGMTESGGPAASGTALAVLQADTDLSDFAALVEEGDLSGNLGDTAGDGGSDNYITLAPTNAALMGVDTGDANAFVLRHITVAAAAGDTLTPGQQNVRTNGSNAIDLEIGGTEGALTVNGIAAELITSGPTAGGQVYKLEGVL